MKLNIGCGSDYKQGFVNIDIHPGSSADVVANALNLPMNDNSVSYIYYSHVLEHLDKIEGEIALLEFYRVLAKNGILEIIVPDLDSCLKKYMGAKRAHDKKFWLHTIYGFQQPTLYDQHKYGYTKQTLTRLLTQSHFMLRKPVEIQISHSTPSLCVYAKKRMDDAFMVLAKTKLAIYARYPSDYRQKYEFINFWLDGWYAYEQESRLEEIFLESAMYFPAFGELYFKHRAQLLKDGKKGEKYFQALHSLVQEYFIDAIYWCEQIYAPDTDKETYEKKLRLVVRYYLRVAVMGQKEDDYAVDKTLLAYFVSMVKKAKAQSGLQHHLAIYTPKTMLPL